MPLISRALPTALLAVVSTAAALVLPSPPPAAAAGQQVPMFQDDARLLSQPQATLTALRELGVQVVRISVHWNTIAPSPRSRRVPSRFNPTDPASYPAAGWAAYDAVVRDAQAEGMTVDLSLGGPSPLWADGPTTPTGEQFSWEPSASQFGKFVQAIATRYGGRYDSLPRVGFWEIWNEPNFGEDLAPQAIDGSTVSLAPEMYRGLVNAAWGALRATGHGNDTTILGNLDARGQSGPPSRFAPQGLPGNYAATKPMQFIRTLYCVDGSYRQLRGRAAALVGCPTNAAGSRGFRAANPGLFQASGFADHPYPVNLPPTQASSRDPDFVEFNELGRLASGLDRLQQVYGSGKRFPIYNNEYGYVTNPPNHSSSHFVSPATAALYTNWAEYLSWRNPRIATAMQYLLYDPNPTVGTPEFGGFASGLIFFSGTRKPGYDAYRLPVFLPVTSTRRGRSLEVWGDARPSRIFGNRVAAVQFQRASRGAFTTVKTVPISNSMGYFDTHIVFPSSGSVRLAWTYPTGPGDPLGGQTVFSRTTNISVR